MGVEWRLYTVAGTRCVVKSWDGVGTQSVEGKWLWESLANLWHKIAPLLEKTRQWAVFWEGFMLRSLPRWLPGVVICYWL